MSIGSQIEQRTQSHIVAMYSAAIAYMRISFYK